MASGDTKTQQYLDIAARGTRADLQRGCCNTRTQDLIMDVAERIITEEETRYREDQILQSEIDEIKNNPDVFDIVPTYAALQAYDTSQLTDKDIIRVLADETHDGASTYYRWSTQTQAFTYIGEVGDYYTREQIDDLLDEKQDELTAGDNITIEDESGALVISATDTTYSSFTGTDGTAAGTAGLVPAPATTDAGKFLKADGTWDTAGGGSSYTAGDGIDITNDIISATNTGKAKVLTTADYNYPTDNPSFVAAYKLEPGFYYADSGVSVKADKNAAETIRGGFFVGYENDTVQIVNPGINSASLSVFLVSRAYGYLTNSVDLYGPVDNLTSTDTDKPLSANQGKVLKNLIDSIAIRGAGAPTTSTVGEVGQLYEDGTNGALYQLKSIDITVTPNTYNWEQVGAGGGSGPTVVQTTGTSTTDVMSQNAVTGMIFNDPGSYSNVAIGTGVSTSAYNNVVIGRNARGGSLTVAIGGGAASSLSAQAFGNYAVAIGADSWASGPQSIALGHGSRATVQGQFDISASHNSGYNNSNYRLLTGLYDPQSDHDAATKGYVDPTTDSAAPTTATVGRLGQIQIDTTTATAYMCVAVDTVTPAYTWKQITA